MKLKQYGACAGIPALIKGLCLYMNSRVVSGVAEIEGGKQEGEAMWRSRQLGSGLCLSTLAAGPIQSPSLTLKSETRARAEGNGKSRANVSWISDVDFISPPPGLLTFLQVVQHKGVEALAGRLVANVVVHDVAANQLQGAAVQQRLDR